MEFLGQRLDNYELVRHIGSGGYADVYCGKHHRLQSLVAIKVLKSAEISPKGEEGFLKEARVLTRLIHPHIIHVIDCGIWQEPDDVQRRIPYIVMTYAPLGNLRSVYPEGTRLPLDKIVLYAGQMAGALQFAHDQQNNSIVHCDVKPENMLLVTPDDLRLSDFGIARDHHNTMEIPNLLDARQGSLKVFGTPGYMPPERCLYGQISRTGDQYSLAVVVYEWLTGFRPFEGDSLAVMRKHAYEDPPAMHRRFPNLNISQEVENVVMKALAKDTTQRYARIEDFSRALAEAITAQQAQPGSPTVASTLAQPAAPTLQAPERRPPVVVLQQMQPASPVVASALVQPAAPPSQVPEHRPPVVAPEPTPLSPSPAPAAAPAPAPAPPFPLVASPSAPARPSTPPAPAASVPAGVSSAPGAPGPRRGGSQQRSMFAGGRPATRRWSPSATTVSNQPISQSARGRKTNTGFEDFWTLWRLRPFYAPSDWLNGVAWLKRYPRSEFSQRPSTLFPLINQALVVLLTFVLLFTALPSSLAFVVVGFVVFQILRWARDLSHSRAANIFLGLVSLYYGVGVGILCQKVGAWFPNTGTLPAILLTLPILALGLSMYWNYCYVRLMHRH